MGYNIRDHISVLDAAKGSRTKYHCPVCNGKNLDIDPKSGAYQCFSNGCSVKDIKATIDKLEGKPEWKPEPENWKKPIRPKSQRDFFYPSRHETPLVKVTRIDDGSGNKKFAQYHWDGQTWKPGNPSETKKFIPIYQYQRVQAAIQSGQLIFIVEGEAAVDLLWTLGITATTTIGGSGGYSSYGNYRSDLKGARLVLAPDRAVDGLKYIGNFERDFSDQIEGYYLAGTQSLWRSPAGGMDIANDIEDLGLNQEQLLKKVISPDAYRLINAVDKLSTGTQTIDLRKELLDLTHTALEESEIKIRLTEVSKARKVAVCALEKIIKEIESEADRDEQRPELKIEIDRLTTAKSTSVDIHRILPPSLAKPIEMLANSLGHNVEPYLLYLLAGTGGVLHSESFIQLRTGYQQPGNLYGGVIAASGSMKSPVQKQMLTKPLAILQTEYNDRYRQDLAQYEIESELWTPDSGEPKPIAPHHHVVYANNITMEAMDIIAAKQPQQSAIYVKDELKAIFMSANQYRQGDDMQAYLSRYDGEQLSKVRIGSGFVSSDHEIKFTMIGTIQPGVAEKLSDGQDEDGLMSRFLFSYLKCRFVPMTEDSGVDIVGLIAGIYRKVHNLPATIYKLSPEAFKKFAVEFDRLRLNGLDTSRKRWEQNVWNKAGGQLGRLILDLHLIWLADDSIQNVGVRPQVHEQSETVSNQGFGISTNASTSGSTVPQISTLHRSIDKIQPETVERAIELIRYFIDQAIGLIAEQSGELSPQLARILDLAKKKGTISPRDITQSANGKNRSANTKQALEFLRELMAMGYGILEKKGRSFIFTPNCGTVDKVGTQSWNTQTAESQPLEPKCGLVDVPPHFSTEEQFSTETDPQPPVINRRVAEIVKISDYFAYGMCGDGIIQVEIAFHHYKTARAWESLIILWGGNADKPHRISRNGKKYLLIARGLTQEKIDLLMSLDLMHPPQQPSRR
jgi:hypothetical protein